MGPIFARCQQRLAKGDGERLAKCNAPIEQRIFRTEIGFGIGESLAFMFL